jgi:ATP-dependent DNA helicase DinG
VHGIEQARADGGRVLVLTTSYALGTSLGGKLADVTIHPKGESLAHVLDRFDTNVLVSPAAWEGIDLPDAWSDIVIPRIPYPSNDQVLDVHFLTAQDQAIRRLTQGFARGLRRPDQTCTIWMLDPRFPLPGKLINAGFVSQGAAARHLRLASSIPDRFRRGLRATFEQGEIFDPG